MNIPLLQLYTQKYNGNQHFFKIVTTTCNPRKDGTVNNYFTVPLTTWENII